MKTTTRSFFALFLLLCSGTVLAQDHVLTYAEIVRPVDTSVTISGDTYKIARIPVVDLVTASRYVLTLAAPIVEGVYLTTFAVASHVPPDFTPNMTIDGFPAHVHVFDGVTYSLNSDFLNPGNNFTVVGSATVSVAIDIGESLVTISNTISAKTATGSPHLTDVNIGNTANAVPFANWGRYGDPIGAISAANKWIDYIRIVAQ